MRVFALLQEPANYTLDLIKNVYVARGVDYGFIHSQSIASSERHGTIGGSSDIWRALGSHDAIVINGYTGKCCLLAIWLNILFFKKPMAIDSDTELQIPANKVKRLAKCIWLRFLFTRKYCYGFAGGNYGHKDLFRHYGMAEERIFLMPMMVDNDKYRRNLPDSPHEPFRFGYLGRLIALKQVDKIIEALPDGCELNIIGDGEDRAYLESVSKGKAVNFYGNKFDEEKIRLLHSFDCLVLYSSYESWGLVVNEALAGGIPVLVSDKVGAKKDLVEGEKQTGIIARWDDVVDLRNKMLEIASDQTKWRSMSKNAIERMGGWDYEHYGKNFDSWIKVVCK